MTSYTYRVLLASWGIYVSVKGSVRVVDERFLADPVRFQRLGVRLPTKIKFTPEETEWFRTGLRIAAPLVTEIVGDHGAISVELLDVTFSYADFQAEGLACALVGLICSQFDISVPEFGVAFDKAANRYVFQLEVPSLEVSSQEEPRK